jgi:hypothetical protein
VKQQTKVFILGAGCSANCGYPLGTGLAGQLEDAEFQSKISGHFPIIERCVRDTVHLAKGLPQFDTLDQLAKHVEDDFALWRQRERSFVWEKTDEERSNLRDKQIIDAKIATAAMFLVREEKARKIGSQSYERFIAAIFGGDPWQEAVKAADCHVMTFNYDRLFEIAFLNHFKSFDPKLVSLYGNCALNSGFNRRVNGLFDKVEPVVGRFNFLKLHGSTGWWVKNNLEQPELLSYWHVPVRSTGLQEIEDLLKKHGVYSWETLNRPNAPINLPWKTLITFPHEKQHSLKNRQTGRSYDPYIRQIWDHAASLLAAATEVKVIGYSFSAIDSRHMVNELLSKATQCHRIVIQNPAVETVKANLASYAQIRERLEFDSSLFGENL